MVLPDVLAERYASKEMLDIWSPRRRVVLERQLWVAALKAQHGLGLDIPDAAIRAYEDAVESVDLDSIATREATLRHDVKARIEEFNAAAGGQWQLVHEGFTSRDATDNVEQLQVRQGLELLRDRTVAVLARLVARSEEFETLDMCGRSHFVAAQTTTLGKRFATWAEELLIAFERLEHFITHYPLRGIKGPMGTQQDMVTLLGSWEKALQFEERIASHLGFSATLSSVGQVYPRSLDFEAVSVLTQLASGPGNMAKAIRLMAGLELAHEGFKPGQTGSSAMPHKVNSRTCERVNGLVAVLGGFLDMTRSLLGDQWLEGDVSCSVVRRVALPGSCFALDGLYEATMTVLDEMEVFPHMIERELRHYLPFLSTTALLLAATDKGLGREQAHGIIKQHAIAAVHATREGKPNPLVSLLANDKAFPLDKADIEALIAQPNHGLATTQIASVKRKVDEVTARYPRAVSYQPAPIR